MSAALDLQGFERVADIEAMLRPLFDVHAISPNVEAAIAAGVERFERLARDMKDDLAQQQRAARTAGNMVAAGYLRERAASIEEFREYMERKLAELAVISESAPDLSPHFQVHLRRLISAEESILESVLAARAFFRTSLEELEKNAESDPVLASLVNAPEDDEPLTEDDERELDEALRSGFVAHEDRGTVQ